MFNDLVLNSLPNALSPFTPLLLFCPLIIHLLWVFVPDLPSAWHNLFQLSAWPVNSAPSLPSDFYSVKPSLYTSSKFFTPSCWIFHIPLSSSLFLLSIIYSLIYLCIYLGYCLLYCTVSHSRIGIFYQFCSILYAQCLEEYLKWGAPLMVCWINECQEHNLTLHISPCFPGLYYSLNGTNLIQLDCQNLRSWPGFHLFVFQNI